MQEDQSNQTWEKYKKFIGIGLVLLFVGLMVAVFIVVGKPLIAHISEPEKFRLWIDGHGIWGMLAFVGMAVLQVIVAFIPGEPLEIAAGYAFGVWEGTILCLLGAVIGGTIVFLFVRYLGVKIVEIFFPMEKIQSLKFLQNSKKLNLLVAILFFIPGTPKDAITYFVGLTPMKLSVWLWITGLARLPSVLTSTVAGGALGVENYTFAFWTFVITIGISLAGILFYRSIEKRSQREAQKEAEIASEDSGARADETTEAEEKDAPTEHLQAAGGRNGEDVLFHSGQ